MKWVLLLIITFLVTKSLNFSQKLNSNIKLSENQTTKEYQETHLNAKIKVNNDKDINDLKKTTCNSNTLLKIRQLQPGTMSDICLLSSSIPSNTVEYTILPSVNGRYTMEFWIKIGAGLNETNILWDKQMKIKIKQTTEFEFTCEPQYYVKLNITTNKQLLIPNDYSTWTFIRCAYNWDNEIYYFSHNNIKVTNTILEKDTIYKTNKFDYPLKYFAHNNEETKLNINFNDNITIRTLYLYNEYLPQEYITSRLKLIIPNINLQHLIFGVDYEIVDNNKITILNRLKNQDVQKIVPKVPPCEKRTMIIPILCEANYVYVYEVYNESIEKCERQESCLVPNSLIKYGCDAYECDHGFYLNYHQKPFRCLPTCPYGWTRSPGSNINSALCNYRVDAKHLPISLPKDLPNDLICNSGYVRVGYKCVLRENQQKTAWYFNRYFNFIPFFIQLDKTTISNEIIDGYYLEFWFLFDNNDKWNGPPVPSLRLYFFWAKPHSFSITNSTVEYIYDNVSKLKINEIAKYEWNHVLVQVENEKIQIFIQQKYDTIPYSVTGGDRINNCIKNIAFCNNNKQNDICKDLGFPVSPTLDWNWASTYYKRISLSKFKVVSREFIKHTYEIYIQSSISSFLLFYQFNNIGSDINYVYNNANPLFNMDYFTSLAIDSKYHHNDRFLMFLTTSNFDPGDDSPGTHLDSINNRVNCEENCRRCYSSNLNSCYECVSSYILTDRTCKKATGTYFQIQDRFNRNLVVNLQSIKLEEKNPVTVTFWMKFFGIKTGKTDPCYLITRISTRDGCYLCYKQSSSELILYYKNTIELYNDITFLQISGQWRLLSFATYNSASTDSYYPHMFSFTYNGRETRQSNQITSPGITFDIIEFGCNIVAALSDIRIYNSFIVNPMGIVTHHPSNTKNLIYHIKLRGTNTIACSDFNDFTFDIGSMTECYYDYNKYQDTEIKCFDEYHYLDNDNNCQQCTDLCTNCIGTTIYDCSCFSNSIYWFRKNTTTEELYCEKQPTQDFSPYEKVEFDNVSITDTNQYTIELFLMVYAYKDTGLLFENQEIVWNQHNKIYIYQDTTTKKINIQCYPVYNSNTGESKQFEEIKGNDYYIWVHVLCGTHLDIGQFFFNSIPLTKLNSPYSKLSSKEKTKLVITSKATTTSSYGMVFIRELRLWSTFALREFNKHLDCHYPATVFIPFLLHHFPFDLLPNEEITENKYHKASIVTKKTNHIGYNIIIHDNKINFRSHFNDCVSVYSFPAKGFISSTQFIIAVQKHKTQIRSYSFYYGLCDYNKTSLDVPSYILFGPSNPGSEIYHYFDDSRFINKSITIVVQIVDVKDVTSYGFAQIDILDNESVNNGLIDYDIYGIGILNIPSPMTIHQTQIRLDMIKKLASQYKTVFEDILTSSVNSNTINYHIPICSNSHCNSNGQCNIVVKSPICICNEGYGGTNCQISSSFQNMCVLAIHSYYLSHTYNNDYDKIDVNHYVLLIKLFTKMINTSISFTSIGSSLIREFYDFMNVVKADTNIITATYTEMMEMLANILYKISNEAHVMKLNYSQKSSLEIPKVDKDMFTQAFNNITNTIQCYINELMSPLPLPSRYNKEEDYGSFKLHIVLIDKTYDDENYYEEMNRKYLSYINYTHCIKNKYLPLYNELILIKVEYTYSPLSFDKWYWNSSSITTDFNFKSANKLDLKIEDCRKPIKLYFPISIYNLSLIEYMQRKVDDINVKPIFDIDNHYMADPVYVEDNGVVINRQRIDRLGEIIPQFSINCSYWDDINKEYNFNLKNTTLTHHYYIECNTDHLTMFTTILFNEDNIYPYPSPFFYFHYPQVFKCGENYENPCFILFAVLVFVLIISIVALSYINYYLILNGDLLESVKFEILSEERILESRLEIGKEVELIYSLKGIDDIKGGQGRKNGYYSNYNVTSHKVSSFWNASANQCYSNNKLNDDTNRYPSSPPKKHFVRHFIDNISDKTESLPEQPYRINERKKDIDKEIEAQFENQDIKKTDMFYNKKIRDRGGFDIDFDDERQNYYKNKKIADTMNKKKKVKFEKKVIVLSLSNDEDVSHHKDDDFSNKNSQKNKKKPIAKEIPVKKYYENEYEIQNLFEANDKKDCSYSKMFCSLMSNRTFFINPFKLYKRVKLVIQSGLILFIFIMLLYFFNTIFLTAIEMTTLSFAVKITSFSLIAYLASIIALIPFIYLIRRGRKEKRFLFDQMKTREQLKFLKKWQNINKAESGYLYAGICLSVLLMLFAFYFSFNYCAVMQNSQITFICSFFIAFVWGVIIEVIENLFCAMGYVKRKKNSCLKNMYRIITHWKNFKSLC